MAFNLVSQLQIQAPANLGKLASDIQGKLKNISATVNLQINPNSIAGLKSLNQEVITLNNSLKQLVASSAAASSSLSRLGGGFSSSSNAATQSSKSISSASTSIYNYNKVATDATNATEEFGRAAGLAGRRFLGFSLVAGSVVGSIAAIKNGFTEALKFEREFIKLTQVGTSTRAELSQLNNEITRLSTALGVSSQELIQTSVTLRQAGLSVKEVTAAMDVLAKTTLAPTFDNIKNTTEGAIAVMAQFRLEAKELEGALGSANAVAAAFAVESKDIITAVQKSGGAFKSVGGDLNEFVALFTSVRATTRESADSIATGLRTVFTRLQRKDTVEALKELGVQLRYTKDEAAALGQTNLETQFVGAYEAVKRLSEGLKNVPATDPRYSAVVEQLGGYRQISKVLPLLQQFETSQKALNIAQSGFNSITTSAEEAQGAFLVKLAKVKEEFLALARTISSSSAFQRFLDTSLKLAKAFLSIADSLSPLIPLLTTLATVKLASNLTSFFSGVTQGFSGVGPKKLASGGAIPGQGNGDTVPAMLTPGEFVINKKAAQRIGYAKLGHMNSGGQAVQHFANGGPVQHFATGGQVFKVGNYDLSPNNIKWLYALANSDDKGAKLLSKKENQKALAGLLGPSDKGVYSTGNEVFAKLGFTQTSKGVVQSLTELKKDINKSKTFVGDRKNAIKSGQYVKNGTLLIPFAGDTMGYVTSGTAGGEKDKTGRDALNAGIRVQNSSADVIGAKTNKKVEKLFKDAGVEDVSSGINVHVLSSNSTNEFQKDIVDSINASIQGIFKAKFTGAGRVNKLSESQVNSIRGYMFEKYIEGVTGRFTAGNGEAFEYSKGKGPEQIFGKAFNKFVFPGPIDENYLDIKSRYSRENNVDIMKKYLNVKSTDGGLAKALGLGLGKPPAPGSGAASPAKKPNPDEFHFATGGVVPGHGDGDTVPARLTPGEFVIRKASAKAIGYENLSKLNTGGVAHFASGGRVKAIKDYLKKLTSKETLFEIAAALGTGIGGVESSDYLEKVKKEQVKSNIEHVEKLGKFGRGAKPYAEGGFVVNKDSVNSTLKELKEETGINFARGAKSIALGDFSKTKNFNSSDAGFFNPKNKVVALNTTSTTLNSSEELKRVLAHETLHGFDNLFGTADKGNLAQLASHGKKGPIAKATALLKPVTKDILDSYGLDPKQQSTKDYAQYFTANHEVFADVVSRYIAKGKDSSVLTTAEDRLALASNDPTVKLGAQKVINERTKAIENSLKLIKNSKNKYAAGGIVIDVGDKQSPKYGGLFLDKPTTGGASISTPSSVGLSGIAYDDANAILRHPKVKDGVRSGLGLVGKSSLALNVGGKSGYYLKDTLTQKNSSVDFPTTLKGHPAIHLLNPQISGDYLKAVNPKISDLADTSVGELFKGTNIKNSAAARAAARNIILQSGGRSIAGYLFESAITGATQTASQIASKNSKDRFDLISPNNAALSKLFGNAAYPPFLDVKAGLNGANKSSLIKKASSLIQTNDEKFSLDALDSDAYLKAAEKKILKETSPKGSLYEERVRRGFPTKFASGGSAGSDTIPAMLTPGEFVINKDAASRIGLGNLHHMNQNGKVRGYNKGGPVQYFEGGGDAKPSTGGEVSYTKERISYSKLNADIERLGKELENLKEAAKAARFGTKEYEDHIKKAAKVAEELVNSHNLKNQTDKALKEKLGGVAANDNTQVDYAKDKNFGTPVLARVSGEAAGKKYSYVNENNKKKDGTPDPDADSEAIRRIRGQVEAQKRTSGYGSRGATPEDIAEAQAAAIAKARTTRGAKPLHLNDRAADSTILNRKQSVEEFYRTKPSPSLSKSLQNIENNLTKVGSVREFATSKVSTEDKDKLFSARESLVQARTDLKEGKISQATFDATKANTSLAGQQFLAKVSEQEAKIKQQLIAVEEKRLAVHQSGIPVEERKKIATENIAKSLAIGAKVTTDTAGKITGLSTTITSTDGALKLTAEQAKKLAAAQAAAKHNAQFGPPPTPPSSGGGFFSRIFGSPEIDPETGKPKSRLKSLGQRLSGGALVGVSIASSLGAQQFENKQESIDIAAATGDTSKVRNNAGIGGALTGAATGAAIGSLAGPVGAVVGGVLGAGHGLYTALNEVEKEIRSSKIAKSLADLTLTLENAVKSNNPLSSGDRDKIASNIDSVKTNISLKSAAESTSFFSGFDSKKYNQLNDSEQRATVGKELPGIYEILGKESLRLGETLGKTTSVLDTSVGVSGTSIKTHLETLDKSFIETNRPLLEVIASFKKLSVEDVARDFNRQRLEGFTATRRQELAKNSGIDLGQQLGSFNRLSILVDQVSNSMKKLEATSINLNDTFESTISNNLNLVNFNSASPKDFSQGVSSLSGALGSQGGDLAKYSSEFAKIKDELTSKLPEVLSRPGLEGQNVDVEIAKSLRGSDSGNNPQREAIINSISKTAGIEGLEGLRTGSKANIRSVIEKLTSEASPIEDLSKITSSLNENANKFVNELIKAQNRVQRVGEQEDRVEQLKLARLRNINDRLGEVNFERGTASDKISLEQLQAPQKARGERLTGLGAQSENVGAIAAKLNVLNIAIEEATVVNQQGVDKDKFRSQVSQEAADKLVKLQGQAVNLQTALKELTDVATRSAAVQEKLNDLRINRDARLSASEKFAKADNKGRAEISRDAINLDKAIRNRTDISTLSQRERESVLRGAEFIGPAKANIGGKVRTGDDAKIELLSRNKGGAFLPTKKDQAEENRLNAEKQAIHDTAVEAGKLIATNSKTANDKLVEDLKALQSTFFEKLDSVFSKEELNKEQQKIAGLNIKGGELKEQSAAADELKKNLGGDIKGKDIDYLKNNKGDIQKLFQNTKELQDLNVKKDTGVQSNFDIKDGGGYGSRNVDAEKFGRDVNDDVKKILDKNGLSKYIDAGKIATQVVSDTSTNTGFGRARISQGSVSGGTVLENATNNVRIQTEAAIKKAIDDLIQTKTGERGLALEKFEKQTNLGVANGLNNLSASESFEDFAKRLDKFNNGEAFDKLAEATKAVAEAMKTAFERISEISGVRTTGDGLTGLIGGAIKSVSAEPHATGGAISGAFKPVGTDTVPAMLTPGEFVVNAKSAATHKSLLTRINSGTSYLAGGGFVELQNKVKKSALDAKNAEDNLVKFPGSQAFVNSLKKKAEFYQKQLDIANKNDLSRSYGKNFDGVGGTKEKTLGINIQLQEPKRKFSFRIGEVEAEARGKGGFKDTGEKVGNPKVKPKFNKFVNVGGLGGTVVQNISDEEMAAKDRARAERARAAEAKAKAVPENAFDAQAKRKEQNEILRMAGGRELPDIIVAPAEAPDFDALIKGKGGPGHHQPNAGVKPGRPVAVVNPDTAILGGTLISPNSGPQLSEAEQARKDIQARNKARGVDPYEHANETARLIKQAEDIAAERKRIEAKYGDAILGGKTIDYNINQEKAIKFAEERAKGTLDRKDVEAKQTDYQQDILQQRQQEELRRKKALFGGAATFATGGVVPGSGYGDTVPAMLTPGEFVLNSSAVNTIGLGNLHRMNSVGKTQHFAAGGQVKRGRGDDDGGSISLDTRNFARIVSRFETSLTILRTAFGAFDASANTLAQAMQKFPATITGNFTHAVNVNITGAEALAALSPELEKIAVNKAKQVLSNYVKANEFPGGVE